MVAVRSLRPPNGLGGHARPRPRREDDAAAAWPAAAWPAATWPAATWPAAAWPAAAAATATAEATHEHGVAGVGVQPGTNCLKIGLPGKLILGKRKGLLEVLFS